MKKLSIVAILLMAAFTGCREDENEPVQINMNDTIEGGSSTTPFYWMSYNGNNKYITTWSSQYSSSPTKSLSISTQVGDATDFAYWSQRLCDGIPAGKAIFLRAKVKGNLSGQGISIALRADPQSGNPLKFITTQGTTSIVGTFDWTEFKIEMPSVPDGTACVFIFLVYLPNTTGEAYFDDVSLVHY